ncbi:chromate transporter [Paenibacillus cremeus]|uniref:Chromate transporter n=1 Tax=Paenibacillus cremeus TaxID=2163881 RepID=A0A559KEL4_9BACL|nr:chromate transporter [Paenibacillus cremeus]TVY10564.1 chromate transporter [Paenibacillus cremeus]
MYWDLFITFLKIGFISFGGGYAMIPVLRHEVISHRWMSDGSFDQVISLAGIAPGPIATNGATLIGYQSAGWIGAVVATLGMVLPSLLLMVLLSGFLYRVRNQAWLKSTFYGLKPVVTGLVIYAAIHFAIPGGEDTAMSWKSIGLSLIFIGAVVSLLKFRLHPLTVILLSGLLGIAFYQ